MPGVSEELSEAKAKQPKTRSIDRNLFIRVSPSGTETYRFRYMINGKSREMSLGLSNDIEQSEAIFEAKELRKKVRKGLDPMREKKESLKKQKQEIIENKKQKKAKGRTFKIAAEEYILSKKDRWSARHAKQWESSLKQYVYPKIGEMPVGQIKTSDVMDVLKPIWKEHKRIVTGDRIRNRIELIWQSEKFDGNTEGANPAAWKGHLEFSKDLPKKIKPKHFCAMPYEEIGSFLKSLRTSNDVAALALEFLILTATRTGELLGSKLSEINERKRYWLIPKDRTKTKTELKIPLSDRALKVIALARKRSAKSDYIFSRKPGKKLNDMALWHCLRESLPESDATVHAFRASFRTWAAQTTEFSSDVIEKALNHATGNQVVDAYQRGDLYEKRIPLMDAWAKYCSKSRAT